MYVLGIETSCDETGVALYHSSKGLIAHEVYSQTDVHERFGGVVPELASRDHIRKALPLIDELLCRSGLSKNDLHGIAYTKAPGLVGALMVGAVIGRSLAFALNIPSIGVHHLEAHLMAAMLEEDKPVFPFVALLVSGGHTMLIEVKGLGQFKVLGQSVDDAVGEAFDKTAKLLGLPYPGGAKLAQLAEQGDSARFNFPRPMQKHVSLNFSFSGLKTHARQCFQQHSQEVNIKENIACAFEDAVVDILLHKSARALRETGLQQLVVAGGVGANKKLRNYLTVHLNAMGAKIYYPRPEFCTDNGAMVAYLGYLYLHRGQHDGLAIEVKPRWELADSFSN